MKLKLLGTLSLGFFIVACGEQAAPPIAFKTVVPVSEEGSFRAQSTHTQDLLPTLLSEVIKNGVPSEVATAGFAKYDQFQAHVRKTDWMALIDFTKPSGKPRFYMINTSTGEVDATFVAHGRGSDPKNTGTAVKFSNTPNSGMSSLGAYIVSEKYISQKHGTTARLDGLESSNSFVRPRDIILHSAAYVTPKRSKMGMSLGCPALSFDKIATALSRLMGGAFMYAYGHPSVHAAMDELAAQQMLLDPNFRWISESESEPSDGYGGD